MTSQEARQQVEACERQITDAYSNLRDAVRSVGSSTTQAASSKATTNTLLPLIISVLGIILFFSSHPVWGVLLIIAGIVIAYNIDQAEASALNMVKNRQKNLNSILDDNSKI